MPPKKGKKGKKLGDDDIWYVSLSLFSETFIHPFLLEYRNDAEVSIPGLDTLKDEEYEPSPRATRFSP
jgi:hypothetical protein